MNKSEAIASLASDRERFLNRSNQMTQFVANLPDTLSIMMVDTSSVYLDSATYADNMATLHELRREFPIELTSYYYNGSMDSGTLALLYKVKAFDDCEPDIVFYCTDVESALQKVGGGKCQLVEQTKSYTNKRVVCGL